MPGLDLKAAKVWVWRGKPFGLDKSHFRLSHVWRQDYNEDSLKLEVTVGISQEEQEKEIWFDAILKLLLISFIQKVQQTADACYLSKGLEQSESSGFSCWFKLSAPYCIILKVLLKQ